MMPGSSGGPTRRVVRDSSTTAIGLFLEGCTDHAVRLARARLPVRKHADVVAFERVVESEPTHVVEQHGLGCYGLRVLHGAVRRVKGELYRRWPLKAFDSFFAVRHRRLQQCVLAHLRRK